MDEKTGSKVLGVANLMMVTMLLSRLLGFLRDIIIYAQIGQNSLTDAYNAAFSIPDFLYQLLVGGALSSAFIPVFSAYIARHEEEDGWKVVSIVFNWILLLLVIGVTAGMIFAPQLVQLLVPGFDPATLHLTVLLTRIMFIQVIFMCFSGISTGILNSYKLFAPSAFGSLLYNLGIIIGGVCLAGPIEAHFPGFGIAGFSIGVVFGALLNFAVQIPALLRVGMHYHFCFDIHHPGFKQLIALIIPVFIGLAISEVNLFVNQNLASSLDPGNLAALRSAQRLMQVPISIFGISIAVAFFPTMSGYVAQKDIRSFKESAMMSLRAVLFITIPAAFGMAVLRVPIIRFMFEFSGGKFTSEATDLTAYALLFYCIGIFAYAGIHVLSRAFYSLHDTKTPVMAAAGSIVVNIVLSIYLVRIMQQGGLALAYSLAGLYNLVVLLLLLRSKVGEIGLVNLFQSFAKTVFASLCMVLVVSMFLDLSGLILPLSNKIMQLVQLGISAVLGAFVFAVIALRSNMPEANIVINIIKRKFRRGKAAAEQQ